MFELLVGTAFGSLVGFGLVCVPGLSPLFVLWTAGVIGLILPGASTAAMLSAYVMFVMLNSAKESLSPQIAGSLSATVNVADVTTLCDSWWLCNYLWFGKLLGLLLGLGTALLVPTAILSTHLPTWLVACVLGLLLCSSLSKYALQVGVVVLSSQMWFAIAPLFGVAAPVIAMSISLFVIPAGIRASKQKVNEGIAKPKVMLDLGRFLGGSVLSFMTAGISPHLIVSGTSAKVNLLTQVSAAAAELAVDSFCLVMLSGSVMSGKSLLGAELGAESIGTGELLMFAGVALASRFLLSKVYGDYGKAALSNYKPMVLINLVLNTALVFITAGPILGVLLLLWGISVDAFISRSGAPSTVRSLLFIGPML